MSNWTSGSTGNNLALQSSYPATYQNLGDTPAQKGQTSDGATITAATPTLTKTVSNGNDTPAVTLPGVVAGETVTYTVTATLPGGSITNGSSDVKLVDTLALGTVYVGGTAGATHSSNLTVGTPTISTLGDGTTTAQTLTIDLGSSLTATANAIDSLTFTYNVQILNEVRPRHRNRPCLCQQRRVRLDGDRAQQQRDGDRERPGRHRDPRRRCDHPL